MEGGRVDAAVQLLSVPRPSVTGRDVAARPAAARHAHPAPIQAVPPPRAHIVVVLSARCSAPLASAGLPVKLAVGRVRRAFRVDGVVVIVEIVGGAAVVLILVRGVVKHVGDGQLVASLPQGPTAQTASDNSLPSRKRPFPRGLIIDMDKDANVYLKLSFSHKDKQQ